MKTALKSHIAGQLFALTLTLLGILGIAFVMQTFSPETNIIAGITQALKALAIFIGVFVALRHIERRAWLHGGIIGAIYTVLVFFVLSIIDTNFSITDGLLIESIFATTVGFISALLLRMRKVS